jgi:hypothetical protein
MPIAIPEVPTHSHKALAFKEMCFNWGSIGFSATPDTKEGTLVLCEGGKLIQEWPQKKGLVPAQVYINFKHLNLTHDRASVNFRNAKTREKILQGLKKVIYSSQLSLQEKSAVLNAFYPLLKQERFNLLEDLSKVIQDCPYGILPHVPEFATLNRENTLMLHPHYINTLKEPVLYQSGDHVFCFIQGDLSSPAVVCKIGDKQYYFIDSRLYAPESPEVSLFNFTC